MTEFNKTKWVPQWKIDEQAKLAKHKEMEVELQKGLEKTDSNFPVLGSLPTNLRVWSGGKKFSDLAKEWDTDSQQKAENEKKMAEFEKSTNVINHFVLPKFNNTRRFVETSDFVEPEETTEFPTLPDSVWTVVDRYKNKRRKEKNMEEIANRPPTPEEDGTVWPEKDSNETCWDERR